MHRKKKRPKPAQSLRQRSRRIKSATRREKPRALLPKQSRRRARVTREGRRAERMGKGEKSLKSLKIEDTTQEGGEATDTSDQCNPDGASRLPMKGAVRRGCQNIRMARRERPRRRGSSEMVGESWRLVDRGARNHRWAKKKEEACS